MLLKMSTRRFYEELFLRYTSIISTFSTKILCSNLHDCSLFFLQICHNKSGEINPYKIKELVEAYVKKFRHSRKKDGSGGGGGGVNLGSS